MDKAASYGEIRRLLDEAAEAIDKGFMTDGAYAALKALHRAVELFVGTFQEEEALESGARAD